MNALSNLHVNAAILVTVAAMNLKVIGVLHRKGYGGPIEKLWPRLNLIWRSTLGFDDDADDDNEDENDDHDGELKRDVCAVLCCPGVARLSWGLLASPVLVSAPCALLGSPVPCSPGLFLALLRWPHLAFSSALLGSPVLCSPVLGPALSCARLCSPVLSCFWLTVVDC